MVPPEPARIKHYRVTRKLGQGGMGIVYAATDERLNRNVAIKMILDRAADGVARERFWREARAAAAVNHPNVCQLYEIDDLDGQPYLVMELLDGESLADRLVRGPVELPEASTLGLGVLGALEALHDRDIVHRDLKPSNVFLTRFGVKLLDFGLARPTLSDELATVADLTLPGKVVGTPAYMSPEQLQGHPVDARSDLFAVGALLYEMLAGTPAFGGRPMVDTMHAVIHEQPRALMGSGAIEAMDRVIQRAVQKVATDRFGSAADMAADLRQVASVSDMSGDVPVARAVTRLIVLPFRVLRPDPDTDFLSFGLADAITSSLTGLGSLVVRSSLAAAAFAEGTPDLRRIATETEVDAVLTGTLMRAGDQIRVTAQLLEAPGETVLWSHSVQSALGDLFALQDDCTQRIVESLKIPLTRREEQLLHRDVPATARAYEFYLRGNECARDRGSWPMALDLYSQCVAEDPRFAPGWARKGWMERRIGIYYDRDRYDVHLEAAETSFERALALNPDLPVAHNLYTYVEVDRGHAKEALLRLLTCVKRQRADPDLYAGLVHVCRYCGLLGASIAAYDKARRLDPNIETSVSHSYWFAGDMDRAVATDAGARMMPYLRDLREGRRGQVLGEIEQMTAADRPDAATWVRLVSALRGDVASFEDGLDEELAHVRDPEGLYYWALMAALVGQTDRVFQLLQTAVDTGWMCAAALMAEPLLEPLRGDARLARIVSEMEARHRDAAAAFLDAGGDRLLGLPRAD